MKKPERQSYSIRPFWIVMIAGFMLSLLAYGTFFGILARDIFKTVMTPHQEINKLLLNCFLIFAAVADAAFIVKIVSLLFLPYQATLAAGKLSFKSLFGEETYLISNIEKVYILRFQTQFYIDGKHVSLVGRTDGLDELLSKLKEKNDKIIIYG